MQYDITALNHEQLHAGRFAWGQAGQTATLRETSEVARWSGPDPREALPGLAHLNGDPSDALRCSVLTLWFEAAGCYSLGLFESCILTCGAIIERCLKLEYESNNGGFLKGRWTLGRCIYELDWDEILSPGILDLAKDIMNPRNSRTHALLEHSDPYLAMFGEPQDGTDVLGSPGSLTEVYRGEARDVLETTLEILQRLYSAQSA